MSKIVEENLLHFTESDFISNFDMSKILDFITENPKLQIHISEAIHYVSQKLRLPYKLEYSIDPEEDIEMIYIKILADVEADKAFELEFKIFDEWYEKLPSNIMSYISFYVE